METFANKAILVTGAAGSVGKFLAEELSKTAASRIVLTDNNETELFNLEQVYKNDNRFEAAIGDVRDGTRISQLMSGINLVFHAAALKHVTVCERAPFDAVQSNIVGVQNLIQAAYDNPEVERVISMSSDKAVNPTNVMGTSKLMGERLISAANGQKRGSRTVFSSTRFGNVLGSRGSVVQLFRDQIAAGGAVQLTDVGMTRFVMSPREAVQLVIHSASLACGGEVFVTKMPTLSIKDLATAMINILAPRYSRKPSEVEIVEVGARPGEKMYEELLSEEEVRRTDELDAYFVIKPAFPYIYGDIEYRYENSRPADVHHGYRSDTEKLMTVGEIEEFLIENQLI